MAEPTIANVQQTYEGIRILCTRIVCDDPCAFKFDKVVNAADNYLFQLVAKTSSGTKQLTIRCGDLSDTLDINTTFKRYVMTFTGVTIDNDNSLYIDFPAGTYFLYNLQLERGTVPTKWQPAPEDAAAYTDAAIDGQTQLDIFNKLTNNGQTQGIYLQNSQLYLNASYIQSGTISANYIYGGTLTLGGDNNTHGSLNMLNSSGTSIGGWGKDGLSAKVLTATDYVYIYGGTGSYLKMAPYGATDPRFVEISSGFVPFHVSGPYSRTHVFAEISGSSMYFNVSDDPPDAFGSGRIIGLTPWGVGMSDHAASDTDYSAEYKTNGFSSFYKSGNQNYTAVECSATRIMTHGTKSRLVFTEQYGNRAYYCYETPSPVFGDIGEGEIGEDGLAYVWLDPIVAETVTTSGYQVFLQKYGEGDAFVKERTGAYFVVQGEPGLSFGWEVKGKQADYDQIRFEKLDPSAPEKDIDYGKEAVAYMNELYQGRISA